MKRVMAGLVVVCVSVFTIGAVTGCSTPGGKAATYKAKKASPLHDTADEKVAQKAKKFTD